MDRIAHRIGELKGSIGPPGDKSISHRALIMAAMAAGVSQLRGCAPGDDVAATADSLRALGVKIKARNKSHVEVEGIGWRPVSRASIDARNSGTTMRLLSGALAGRHGTYVLSGDASLSKRPMDRIALPLRKMGAGVELAGGRYPPVKIVGGPLEGIDYQMDVASAQVKGAIILAGLQASGPTRIFETDRARDHTERLLQWLGAPVRSREGMVEVSGEGEPIPLGAFELSIPGDFSSAAYLITAAALVKGSELIVEGVGVNPTRTGFLEILRSMGADVSVEVETEIPEPSGRLIARHRPLRATAVEGKMVPGAIDELPLVALLGTQAEGTTVIRDAGELRVKEADRISALAAGLRAMGAEVEEFSDGLAVRGPVRLRGAEVDPEGDHRLALTFAVAGLMASSPVKVAGWECTKVSYPGFDEDLLQLAG